MKLINIFSFRRLFQGKPLNHMPFMLSKKDKTPDKEKDKTTKDKNVEKEKEGFPWE